MTGARRFPDRIVSLRRRDTGIIDIGELPESLAGVGFVGIAGGTAYVDPAYPERLPCFEIADAAAAYDALTELLGSDLADACVSLQSVPWAPDTEPEAVAKSVASPTPALESLVDLATVHWLSLQAPWPLDEIVLELEMAVARAQLEGCLDPDVDPVGGCRQLSETILAALNSADELPSRVRELTLDAAGLLLDDLPTNDPRWQPLDAALARWQEQEAPPEPSTMVPDLEPILAACTPELALAAGDTPQIWANAEAVDWRFVRRGLVARDESAVSWALDLSPHDPTLSVSVGAADWQASCLPPTRLSAPQARAQALQATRLEVTAHLGAEAIVLAMGRLQWDADRGTWAARIPLSTDVDGIRALLRQGGLTVHVHEAGRDPGLISDAAQAAAAAVRWGARGLCAARLSDPSNQTENGRADERAQLRDASRAALTTARQIWRLLPGAEAAARAQRCGEIVEALTAGTFSTRQSVTESLLTESAAVRP